MPEAAAAPGVFVFSGYIRVPAGGVYRFELAADGTSFLFLGPSLTVENQPPGTAVGRTGPTALGHGLHPIAVLVVNEPGDKTLRVRVDGPRVTLREIPPGWLKHAPADPDP